MSTDIQPVRIFIAYAHEDDTSREKLRRQLSALERRGHFQIFWDGLIKPGERWDERLKDELHRTDIFLLLVSEYFLDSDYVHEVELPKALALRNEGKVEIFPVILRACLWRHTELNDLQCIMCDGKQRLAAFESARMEADNLYSKKQWQAVTLSDFEIGKYPVTQKLWQEIMNTDPSHFKGNDLPVENVSWDDVQEFLQKLNARFPDKIYRLPTEAEWEFAARGGTLSKGFTYAGSNDLKEVGWCWENSGDNPLSGGWKSEKITQNNGRTHPVGQKRANELGICDMSGNVWEWCDSWYDQYPSIAQTNPNKPGSGSLRVVRGGS